jgi:hypothetical protein
MMSYIFDNDGKYMIIKGRSKDMFKVYYEKNKFYFVKKGIFCMCKQWEETQKCEHFDIVNNIY